VKSHLINLDRQALELMNAGQLSEAIKIFHLIIKEQPDWEHGTALYNLASCYEDLQQPALAEEFYQKAVELDTKNPIFLGGLASFLALKDKPDRAFDAYLTLLQVEESNDNKEGIKRALMGLKSLGGKMGLSAEQSVMKIKAKIPSLSDRHFTD
jgi:Flp pilus assembly protein TadD